MKLKFSSCIQIVFIYCIVSGYRQPHFFSVSQGGGWYVQGYVVIMYYGELLHGV
jgi:hypothetical protein